MIYDSIIIGSGPAGCSCAIYLKRANKNIILIDNNYPCSNISNIDKIENLIGFSSISGMNLANNIYEQILNLNIDFKKESIISIEKKDYFIVKTNSKEYITRSIVIAIGHMLKKLGLEHEEELIGNGISYCVKCDGAFYKDKDVLVVGNNKQTIDDIDYLRNICKHIFLITSLKKDLFKDTNVEIIDNSIKQLIIKNDQLNSIILDNDKKIEIECIFVNNGIEKKPNYFNLLLETNNNHIVVNSEYETSIKGIYAIGDCIKKDVYQIVTAASDGAIAASNLIKKLK